MSKYKLLFILLLMVNHIFPAVSFGQALSVPLESEWAFREAGSKDWMPATVPGCVHTDLLQNKKIEDPFYRTNEEGQQWIGQRDWEYTTRFNVAPLLLSRSHVSMVFEGLDTYADVYLNGEHVLAADNMHRTWRIDCKGRLKEKDNQLQVYFHSVFKKALPLMNTSPVPLFQFPNNDQADTMISTYVRKAGYHFGWDWGPRLVTAGIWKPIRLEAFDAARIDAVQISTRALEENKAHMLAVVDVVSATSTVADIILQMEGKEMVHQKASLQPGHNSVALDFDVINPELWWSNGMGKPQLYHFTTDLLLSGQVADSLRTVTGIRTLKVVTEPDQWGRSLYVLLNGHPVFMKGANYIPSDNFTNRTTEKQYEYTIRSAAEANMNMLRIWGGGYFEKELFYSLCDQYGILIWQDMLFACGTYPGNESYYASVREEVRDNIRRLRNHPCIALYNGNNEVEVAFYQWGWKEKLSPENQLVQEANMKELFYKVIPDAIRSVDTTRYYHPTSPNTGYKNIPLTDGDVHYWSVWHGKEPFESYFANVGRFMSEYGFQSYPELETVKSFTLPEDRDLNSKVMQAHQRCMAEDRKDKEYGNRLIRHYLGLYYREPSSFEYYLYVSQLVQKKGMAMAIEAHRRNMPKCMGTLYWQINDCWPVASWSSIDYLGRWKAAHYKVRELYKDVLISPIVEKDSLLLYIVSDKVMPIAAELAMVLTDFGGRQLYKKAVNLTIAPNTSKVYVQLDTADLLKGIDKRNVVLSVQLQAQQNTLANSKYFFVPEKDLQLTNPNIVTSVAFQGGKYKLTLTAKTLAKDVFISVAGVSGRYSNNYFDILPGETMVVYFEPDKLQKGLEHQFRIISLVDSYDQKPERIMP